MIILLRKKKKKKRKKSWVYGNYRLVILERWKEQHMRTVGVPAFGIPFLTEVSVCVLFELELVVAVVFMSDFCHN